MNAEVPNYKQAFPNFDLDVTIPDGFIDRAQCGLCPSFENEDLDLILYVDYSDSKLRAFADSERFTLVPKKYGTIRELHEKTISTDNWDQILEEIENLRSTLFPKP